jgi:peptidoglycan/LPS O-acetylase OafA/YrhL
MKKVYLPGINGLRGIAAMLVVIHHVTKGLSRYKIAIPKWIDIAFTRNAGSDAVTIFFVISGFLITYLLLAETKLNGAINIKKFYLRRILRIWPVYYLYLFIAIIISFVMHDKLLFHYLPFYIFFAGNIPTIVNVMPFYIVHFWSLGVEEQFYLFWPFIFKYFKGKLIALLFVLAAILCLQPLLSNDNTNHLNHTFYIFIRFVSNFQGILIGCITALLFSKNRMYFSFCFNKICQAAALILMVLLITNGIWIDCFHDAITSVLSVIILIALIENKSFFLKTENKVLNHLGKISYGLYVWHPFVMWLFLRMSKQIIVPAEYLIWIICIGTPLFSILIADISYRYFEVRFLKMKRKFMIVPSSNTAEAF